MDPDPGGPNTYESYGSGSATLVARWPLLKPHISKLMLRIRVRGPTLFCRTRPLRHNDSVQLMVFWYYDLLNGQTRSWKISKDPHRRTFKKSVKILLGPISHFFPYRVGFVIWLHPHNRLSRVTRSNGRRQHWARTSPERTHRDQWRSSTK